MKSKILSAFCAAICLPGVASGAAITVNNASFEDNDATQNGQNWADGIPSGWNSQGGVAGSADPLTVDGANGNYFLELSGAIGSTGGDGINYLGIRANGFVYQDLGVIFQPNTIYTVDLLVSRRDAQNNIGWFGIADDTAAPLGDAGAADTSAFTTANQFLAASSLIEGQGNIATFTTGAAVPSGNVFVAVGSTSGNMVFDLVSVDASPGHS